MAHVWEVVGVPPSSQQQQQQQHEMEFVVATGREQSLHCTEVWRPQTERAVAAVAALLADSAFAADAVEPALQALQHMCIDMPHELLLQDAIQQAAFGTEQALGRPHFVADEATLQQLSPRAVLDHWTQLVTNNPQGIVVGAVGGDTNDHDALCRMVDVHVGHLQQTTTMDTTPSVYKGGRCIVDRPLDPLMMTDLAAENQSEVEQEKRLSRVGLVWPTGGWHATEEFVAACVLQSLWGGGSSFSAGGPGKGMYSRLYRTVLNQYHWVESAEAFAVFFDEAGLLGIVGSAPPAAARDLIKLFCHHLLWLANKPVQDEELNRAKSMLRCNVLMQLESRLVSFEDVSRQVLTYGRHEPMSVTAERIEAVTPQHLQDLAIRMLQHPPSLAVVGMDLSPDLPSEEELQEWLRR